MNAIKKTEVSIKNCRDGTWKWLVEVEYIFGGGTWRTIEERTESSYLTAKKTANEAICQTQKRILAEQRSQRTA